MTYDKLLRNYLIKHCIFRDRAKNNNDWKNQSYSSQLSQNSADMVPECDSHWPNSSPTTSQAVQGSHPETTHSGNVNPSRKRSTNEAMQPQQQLDESQLVQIATDAFVQELGIEDETLLKDRVQIREVPAGTYLMKEESHKVCRLVCTLLFRSYKLSIVFRKHYMILLPKFCCVVFRKHYIILMLKFYCVAGRCALIRALRFADSKSTRVGESGRLSGCSYV